MKLYTREQMIEAFNYGQKLEKFDWIGDMIDSLEAIELPSVTTTLKEEAHEEKVKEEAKELIDAFKKLYNYTSIASPICDSTAKECALICVDKLITAFEYQRWDFGDDYDTTWSHYKKLKKQIEKL